MKKPENYKPLFSKPNLKHIKDGIYSFSIPHKKTCIGSTKKCRSYCMVDKGNFKRFEDTIQGGYHVRYLHTLKDDFVYRLNYELKNRIVNKKKIDFVRFHVSGDIYNQNYKNKLFAIMAQNPKVRFLIYSKSLCYNFDDYRSLKNVGFIQSRDTKFKPKLNSKYSIATIYKTKADIPKNSIDCTESDLLAFKSARKNLPIALLEK